MTKGDNNQIDDRGLYPRGQMWLRRDMVLGKAVAYVNAHCAPRAVDL